MFHLAGFRRVLVAVAAGALAAAGCRDAIAIPENWGPASGYTRVKGTVRHAGGAPANGHAVLFGGCHPIEVTWAPSFTTQAGTYEARGVIPPALPLSADTAHTMCRVVVDYGSAPTDSVLVSFSVDSMNPARTTLDLMIP